MCKQIMDAQKKANYSTQRQILEAKDEAMHINKSKLEFATGRGRDQAIKGLELDEVVRGVGLDHEILRRLGSYSGP